MIARVVVVVVKVEVRMVAATNSAEKKSKIMDGREKQRLVL